MTTPGAENQYRESHPWVQGPLTGCPRVSLSESGHGALAQLGLKDFCARLQQELGWNQCPQPRVTTDPDLADCQAGDQSPDGNPSDPWPCLLSLQRHSSWAELIVLVHDQVSWFQGHFPGQAILPGVVQTHWAAEFGRRLFSITAPFTDLQNIKFQRPVLPGEQMLLTLRFDPQRQRLQFSFGNSDGLYSQGRIGFLAATSGQAE